MGWSGQSTVGLSPYRWKTRVSLAPAHSACHSIYQSELLPGMWIEPLRQGRSIDISCHKGWIFGRDIQQLPCLGNFVHGKAGFYGQADRARGWTRERAGFDWLHTRKNLNRIASTEVFCGATGLQTWYFLQLFSVSSSIPTPILILAATVFSCRK